MSHDPNHNGASRVGALLAGLRGAAGTSVDIPKPVEHRSILDVLADCRAILDSTGRPGREADDAADLASALDELLQWVGSDPSPAEARALRSGNVDPTTYTTVPVEVSVHPQAPGQIVKTPVGDVIVLHMLLQIPLDRFATSGSVLEVDTRGNAKNPCEGMLPSLVGRLVLPRDRIADHVRGQLALIEQLAVERRASVLALDEPDAEDPA